MNITNNPTTEKNFFSFWSIKNNYFLLKKINSFLIVLFCFPLVGHLSYLFFVTSKIKNIRKNIFSKILRFDFFIKDFYYSLIIPFIISVLALATFYFLSVCSVIYDLATTNFLYLCIGTILPIFYISHIFFVIFCTNHFNIRIKGLKNYFLGLYKSDIWKKSKQQFVSNELDNKKQDIEDKKFFLERFYKKGLKAKVIQNMVKDDLDIHDDNSFVKLIKSLNIKEYVKDKFSFFIYLKSNFNKFTEYGDDAKSFYTNYLNKLSKEFYPNYEVFKSVSWTKVYLDNLDLYAFKKYLFLFIYFVLSCLFLSSIFSYTIVFANLVSYWRFSWLCFALSYIGFLGVYSLIFWSIWKFLLSKYSRYLDLYCLRSTYLKIQKLNEIGIDNFIVTSIAQDNLTVDESEINLFDSEVKTLDNQKNLFINQLNLLVGNDNQVFKNNIIKYSKSLNFFSKLTNFAFSVLYLLLFVYLCCLYAYDKFAYIVGYFSYAFIILLVVSGVIEIVIAFKIANIKKRITLFNLLYNQKLLYPYFTTNAGLPYIFPVFILNFLGKHSYSNIGPSFFQYDFMFTNLWNFEEKKGFSTLNDNEAFEHFFGDINQLKKAISNSNISDLCSGNLDDAIYSKKFDLTDKVLDGLKEYPL